jgi:hypothetical protein
MAAEWLPDRVPQRDGLIQALLGDRHRMGPARYDLDRCEHVADPAASPAVRALPRFARLLNGKQPHHRIMPGDPDCHAQVEERRSATDNQLAMPRIDDLEMPRPVGTKFNAIIGNLFEFPRFGIEDRWCRVRIVHQAGHVEGIIGTIHDTPRVLIGLYHRRYAAQRATSTFVGPYWQGHLTHRTLRSALA